MSELFSSTSYWIFFILCVAIKSGGGCREQSEDRMHYIPLMNTLFYTGLSALCIIIAAIAVIVLSIQGHWWYSFILLATFFFAAPIAVMLTIQPVSRILGNIVTNIQANHRFFINMDSAREGCGISIWMIISILMELVFSIWMIIAFFY